MSITINDYKPSKDRASIPLADFLCALVVNKRADDASRVQTAAIHLAEQASEMSFDLDGRIGVLIRCGFPELVVCARRTVRHDLNGSLQEYALLSYAVYSVDLR